MATVDPIPAGYSRVTPYLHIDGAHAAIEFYTSVLGATERMRLPGDAPGKVGHAELLFGDSLVMLSDEMPDMGIVGPKTVGGTPVTIQVYVEDVDAVFDAAIAAGAQAVVEPADQFYGERAGQFEDPFGHRWSVATNLEDLTAEEMQRRMSEFADG